MLGPTGWVPDIDGLTLTRRIREESDVGIIILTGRSDLTDRVSGWKSAPTITSPNLSSRLFVASSGALHPHATRKMGRLVAILRHAFSQIDRISGQFRSCGARKIARSDPGG
jgi:CheY-like chemotaxis protein